MSFLYSTTLASALYLLLLRFLARRYTAVVQLVDTVASDTDLTPEEIEAIIAELEQTSVAERSGRAMDHEAEDSFERLRTEGYM